MRKLVLGALLAASGASAQFAGPGAQMIAADRWRVIAAMNGMVVFASETPIGEETNRQVYVLAALAQAGPQGITNVRSYYRAHCNLKSLAVDMAAAYADASDRTVQSLAHNTGAVVQPGTLQAVILDYACIGKIGAPPLPVQDGVGNALRFADELRANARPKP